MRRRIAKKARKITCCGFLAALGFGFFHLPSAGAGQVSSPRYCVVVPPAGKSLNGDFNGLPAGTGGPFARVSGERIRTFFRGQMKKIGFGTPDCFFINGQVKADPVKGVQHVYTGPASDPAADFTAQRGEDNLFPTVGYFNRVSRNESMGVAFGLGLSNSEKDVFGDTDETGRPEARVALMIGFGF